MEPRTRITLYMPPTLLARLEAEAKRRSKLAGVTLSAQKVGRALIEEGLTGRDASFLDLRSAVGGYAGAEQRVTSKDYEPHKHRAVREGDPTGLGPASIDLLDSTTITPILEDEV